MSHCILTHSWEPQPPSLVLAVVELAVALVQADPLIGASLVLETQAGPVQLLPQGLQAVAVSWA